MCGRYVLSSSEIVKKKYNIFLKKNYNVLPSSNVLVLDQNLKPKLLKWSFSPYWAKRSFNIINARSETLEQKISFKESFRCIFVADGYYEWHKSGNIKTPFYIHRKQSQLYFAGIYNNSSGCCIVTKKSENDIFNIHPRQPILLVEDDFISWTKYNYDIKKKMQHWY